MKKIMIIISCLTLVTLFGCSNKSETKKNTKSYVQPTITNKVDEYKFQEREINSISQNYTKGDVTFPNELWQTPEFEYASDLDFFENCDGVKGLFYTSPIEYNGKKTKVCAYIGFPEGATKDNKCPAIVLVHGGLGTCMADWVKYWNDLGFAAISMDTEGAEPIPGANYDNCMHISRNRYETDPIYTCGPTNNSFSDYNLPLTDQWYYHAVSTVIGATSLISSFDCVDKQKIGLTGISWGSMISSVVVGYDDRISFCMPIYGGLSLKESCSGFATVHQTPTNVARWDTLDLLKNTNAKMFYVTSLTDDAFSFDAASRSSQAAGGFTCFKKLFVHGHAPGAYEGNLPFFAKYFCEMESEFVEITNNPTRENPVLKFRTYGGATIDSIKLFYTDSEKTDKHAQWESKAVKYTEGLNEYYLNVPQDSTFCFIQIKYSNNLEVTSYLF